MKNIVAGGCFWGVDHYFSLIKGIVTTKAVYANSDMENISYEQVCLGKFRAVEAVYLEYNEAEISIEQIIELLFRIIDPTSKYKQGEDEGIQYRTGIYSKDQDELKYIENILLKLQKNYSNPIMTEVAYLDNFYDAEDNHQLYLVRNPNGYCHVDMSKIKDNEKKID